jgi:stage III sporulation protein SpoIIIAA
MVDPTPNTVHEKLIVDDLDRLLEVLPDPLRDQLLHHPRKAELVEVVMDLGRRPEARFPGSAEYLTEEPISHNDLRYSTQRVGDFGSDNRAGIERTLHRISAIRNRKGEVVGLTCRVGRAVFGTIGMIRDLVETGKSMLMLGRPGVGKTTALREIARVLADDLGKRVVIIDTSNEIAGDGDVPHPAIGRARRMQVARPEQQHQVMIEAVENHMPEVIVIDEIGTELEALAARTIAERGVMLVGTAHGNQIENLIKNPTLSDLIGGIQSVTLGDDEARRRGSQKTVLERKAPPTFDIAVEMQERYRWVVHEDVGTTVDQLLRDRPTTPQVRTLGDNGQVEISHDLPAAPRAPRPSHPNWAETPWRTSAETQGWRASGAMRPLPPLLTLPQQETRQEEDFRTALEAQLEAQPERDREGNVPLHLYPYAVSRQYLEQVIYTLELPISLTKDIAEADVVLALSASLKSQSKLRQVARNHHVPVHVIKSNTLPQIARALRRLLNRDEPSSLEGPEVNMLLQGNTDDELEALEEARLAVEQIVLTKGQPVELLPRSASIRKMQHELVEHYRLKSTSFGDEPNRRLRIYPA